MKGHERSNSRVEGVADIRERVCEERTSSGRYESSSRGAGLLGRRTALDDAPTAFLAAPPARVVQCAPLF